VLLRYWFVELNPLYFLSALCVLGGVFLVSRNVGALDPESPARAERWLFWIVQAYEILLVGGAFFLVRIARATRPAVLLVLLETVFLFDGTFRLESLPPMGAIGLALCGLWLLLVQAKVGALVTCLRVPLGRQHHLSILAAAATLLVVVVALASPTTHKPLVLQVAAWAGALVAIGLQAQRFPMVSELASPGAPARRAARCIRGALRVLTGAWFLHLWTFILLPGGADTGSLPWVPQLGALFLVRLLAGEGNRASLAYAGLLVGAALPVAPALALAALLAAAALAWLAWKGARDGLPVAAALLAWGGIWLLGWDSWRQPFPPFPGLFSAPTLLLALALGLLAWRLGDGLAGALLGAGVLWAGWTTALDLLPRSELGVGLLLVTAGFVLFVLGLAVNWWLRAPDPPPT
jgi:hypothetical protein